MDAMDNQIAGQRYNQYVGMQPRNYTPQSRPQVMVQVSDNGGFVITTTKNDKVKQTMHTASSVDDAITIIRDKLLELQG